MAALSIGRGCFTPGGGSVNGGGGSGRDFIEKGNVAASTEDIEEVRAYWVNSPTANSEIKLKVWRQNGSNFDFVGQTEPFNIGGLAGCNVFSVNSIISGVQSGDYMGYHLSGIPLAAINIDTTPGSAQTTKYKSGDYSSTQAEATFSTGVWSAPIGLYAADPVTAAIPDLPVRIKNPNTGDVISFFTDYNYISNGIVTKKTFRSVTGNLHTQQHNNFKRFEIPLVIINSMDYNNLKTWFSERVTVFFTENHSITPVDSGTPVRIIDVDVSKFVLPHSQKLRMGEVIMETL